MKQLIKCTELTLATRKELFNLMRDYYEKYAAEIRIMNRHHQEPDDFRDMCIEYRDEYGKITYVLLNSIEFKLPRCWYTELDFEKDLISDFKDITVNEEDYIEVLEKLHELYQDIHDRCKSSDRRIKKSDNEDKKMALKINRTVIKMQKKKLIAIEEYLGVLKTKLK